MNMSVIRCYLLINDCRDDPMPGWRIKLHKEFSKIHPELNLSEQNLADRKNLIYRKQYLSQAEIDNIRREVGNILYHQNEVNEMNRDIELNEEIEEEKPQDLSDEYVHKLRAAYELFVETNPMDRPNIPKLWFKNNTNNIITNTNNALAKMIEELTTIQDIHTAIFAAAMVVLETNGQSLYDSKKVRPRKDQIPAWRQRLEKDIDKLRSNINIIREYLQNNKTSKVRRKIRTICQQHKLNENALKEFQDLQNQKLKIKSARLRRYNEATKRKIHNKTFENNQRIFYRNLNSSTTEKMPTIDKNRFKTYWESIWSEKTTFSLESSWLKTIEETSREIPIMTKPKITEEDLLNCLKRTPNWKAAGPDKIQGFWLKQFTSLHSKLAKLFDRTLTDPKLFPTYLTTGVTYLLPKKGDLEDPKNYRPITCLPTLYKLYTSLLHSKIYKHLEKNCIMNIEQKGCIKNSLGSKEQLIIDSFILKQAEVKCRNLSMAYIDYRKAFDSIPHNWLIKTMEIYKVHPDIIQSISHLMARWGTQILSNDMKIHIPIRRGIYQGDSLSPLLFCLALNPLSTLLNNTNKGYRVDIKNNDLRINHLLFMDDLKLYAENQTHLKSLITTVRTFSEDIKMTFGLEKCAELHLKKGKIMKNNLEPCEFNEIDENKFYTYLGIAQNRRINHTHLKQQFKAKYESRLQKLVNTKLNSKNLTTSINTYAVPILTYSFGILKYSDTDLKELDRTTRRILRKFRMHHPISSTARLYISRKKGGRGLISIFNLCKKIERDSYEYFTRSAHPLLKYISIHDKNYTALNMSAERPNIDNYQPETEWRQRILHAQYPAILEKPEIDHDMSLKCISDGKLHPETEGFLIAIQDRVIATRNHLKYVIKDPNIEDKCRICKKNGETIEHLTAGCEAIAHTEYLQRHNHVAKIIHQQLATKHNLLRNCPPYYRYTPSPVLENDNVTMYWDKQILTDRTVDYNKPDIVFINKKERWAWIIDIACPLSSNLEKTETEKIRKYQNLCIDMKLTWQLDRIQVIPFVISVTGVVTTNFVQALKKTELPVALTKILQRATVLQTCHIVRKILNID